MMQRLSDVWIQYAKDDMKSAKVLLQHRIFNMVCFHCQQAVEKTFKALLTVQQQPVPRTHNLIRLRQLCEDALGSGLRIDDDALSFLNDIYLDSRYPADLGLIPSGFPNDDDAEMAVKYMEEICITLRNRYDSVEQGTIP
jgi:HEPN domain-containing protein